MNIPGPKDLMVGLDVGSTTVKSVVVDLTTQQIVSSDYQRHDTKQPEKCLEFLKRIEADTGTAVCRLYGSRSCDARVLEPLQLLSKPNGPLERLPTLEEVLPRVGSCEPLPEASQVEIGRDHLGPHFR